MDSKINEHWEHQNTSKNCKDISGYPGKAKITKHNFLETPKKRKDEEQAMTKKTSHLKPPTHKQKRIAITDELPRNGK